MKMSPRSQYSDILRSYCYCLLYITLQYLLSWGEKTLMFYSIRLKLPLSVIPPSLMKWACVIYREWNGRWEGFPLQQSGDQLWAHFVKSFIDSSDFVPTFSLWSPNCFLSLLLSLHHYYVDFSVLAANQKIKKEYNDRVRHQWDVTFYSNARYSRPTLRLVGEDLSLSCSPMGHGDDDEGDKRMGLAWQPRVLGLVSHAAGFHRAGGWFGSIPVLLTSITHLSALQTSVKLTLTLILSSRYRHIWSFSILLLSLEFLKMALSWCNIHTITYQ